jgi:LmbE family N-acetylglucosaminyl deacetylase
MTIDSLTDLTRLGTVLAIWAHPDDETYLAGGLLAALRDHGQRAVCVTATRGEAAKADSTPGERATLARLRSRELEDALAALGVVEHHWLDLPDGGCADLDPQQPVSDLTRLLDDVRPDTVITFGPDGYTGHPDHQVVSAWTDLAVAGSASDPLVLHAVSTERARVDPGLDDDFGVFTLGRPRMCDERDLAVHLELGGPALERKVEALLRQRSQTSGLLDAVGLDRFRAWVATECFAPKPAT